MAWNIVPFGMVPSGQNTVANINADLFNGFPVVGPSPTTPTVAVGAAAGSGATVSVVGSNIGGIVTFNSGTGLLGGGALFTLTYAGGFTYPAGSVASVDANNSAAASAGGNVYITTTTTSFTLNVVLGVNVSTAFKFMYICAGW